MGNYRDGHMPSEVEFDYAWIYAFSGLDIKNVRR